MLYNYVTHCQYYTLYRNLMWHVVSFFKWGRNGTDNCFTSLILIRLGRYVFVYIKKKLSFNAIKHGVGGHFIGNIFLPSKYINKCINI